MSETKLDYQQTIKNEFNETNSSLNVTVVVGVVDNTPTALDAEQIFKKVYDENTQTLRVIFV